MSMHPGVVVRPTDDARTRRNGRLARSYGLASVLLVALHPFLPLPLQLVDLALVYLGSAVCVAVGRRALRRHERLPWTLLLAAQFVLISANVGQAASDPSAVTVGLLLGIVGNLLAVAAGFALILRRSVRDLGGLVDAAVIGFAVGGVLWAVLPHGDSWPQRLHLFVVAFALPATLGPLVRLLRGGAGQRSALWWLLAALGLALAGHVSAALGEHNGSVVELGQMLFMLSLTAVGLFALDPSGLRATSGVAAAVVPERLSTGRLALLGLAVIAVPTIGANAIGADVSVELLLVQGTLITGLVMARIGLLAAAGERAEQTLHYRATHDALTQLPNRHAFISRLRDTLAAGEPCALLFCDLDEFKVINDRYGHEAGDQLLVDVAYRLRQCVRAPDIVGRIGGDEFVVLLLRAGDDEAAAVRDRLEQALANTSDSAGGGIRISIGFASSQGTDDAEQLLKAADHAMYQTKKARGQQRSGFEKHGSPGRG